MSWRWVDHQYETCYISSFPVNSPDVDGTTAGTVEIRQPSESRGKKLPDVRLSISFGADVNDESDVKYALPLNVISHGLCFLEARAEPLVLASIISGKWKAELLTPTLTKQGPELGGPYPPNPRSKGSKGADRTS
jgi:hypothetical protein